MTVDRSFVDLNQRSRYQSSTDSSPEFPTHVRSYDYCSRRDEKSRITGDTGRYPRYVSLLKYLEGQFESCHLRNGVPCLPLMRLAIGPTLIISSWHPFMRSSPRAFLRRISPFHRFDDTGRVSSPGDSSSRVNRAANLLIALVTTSDNFVAVSIRLFCDTVQPCKMICFGCFNGSARRIIYDGSDK